MTETERQCEGCGKPVDAAGVCPSCGSGKRTATKEAQNLVSRVQNLLVRGGAPAPVMNVKPEGASLVDKASGQTFRIVNTVSTIGRDRTCDVTINNDPCVSRQHAAIAFIDGNYFVEDLGSTNGTMLNGKAVTERRKMQSGDRVMFGKTEMTFEMAPPRSDLGDYELLSELGRGGMGIVFKAKDRKNGRLVAIKQLNLDRVDASRHKYLKDRFKREAMTAARLNHPNIVTVLGVDAAGEHAYYVMEFLEGHNLVREFELRGGRLTPEEFLPVLQQVAESLAYAHSMRIVHRDVKPDNIFIRRDGRVKLTDFGIAAVMDYEQTKLTLSGSLVGTPSYVSPEQIQDPKHVDHRADIFSLGVVAFQALAGRLPFDADGLAALAMQIVSEEAPALDAVCTGVGEATAAVIAKALCKKAKDRYPSALDFLWDYKRSLLPGAASIRPNERTVTPVDTFLVPELSTVVRRKQDDLVDTGDDVISPPLGQPPEPSDVTMPSSPFIAKLVNPLGIIGADSTSTVRLSDPFAICCGLGQIVVSDNVTARVQILTQDGTWQSNIEPLGEAEARARGLKPMTTVTGLAMDARGQIFVSDAQDASIRVFDSEGHYLREFANPESKGGGLQAVACDFAGLVYASDAGNHCVQVFNADDGSWVRRLEAKAKGKDLIHMPAWLAVDRKNRIYLLEFGACQVLIFEPDGTFLRSFAVKASGNGLLCVPAGIVVDKNELIYISDSLNNKIQVFSPAGDFLYCFGSTGSSPGQFIQPAGVCIEWASNKLFVSDRGNHRLQIFELKQQ